MRLKYQLRGLGIGMILGVLLMGVFAGTKEETLTDAQIKERAKALGMEEAIVLSDLPEMTTETTSETETEVTSETETEVTSETETEMTSEIETEMTSEIEPVTSEMASMDQAVLTEEKMVVITIKSGDGSGTVSSKLEQAGLIKDANAYDKYLCKNGYDKKIRVGNHEILYGATEEEIAQSISSN